MVYNKSMIKKLIWLAIFVGIVYGVYSIGPWVHQKYSAYLAGETARMDKVSNHAAQQMAAPATSGAEHKANDVRRKLDAIDRNQENQE